MHIIHHERPEDAALIDPLLDRAFGPDRMQKTVYRLREGRECVPELSLAARDGDKLVGTIRYWAITIGGKDLGALLLGPIAVEPDRRGEGIGVQLILESLALARAYGYRICILVGDPDYYVRFGFMPASPYGLILPGPVDDHRFLALDLEEGALKGVGGIIGPGGPPVGRSPGLARGLSAPRGTMLS